MKLTVLGAGAIGSAVAYDLARCEEVTRVQVCETQPVTLRAFRAAFAHPKIRTYEADARDTQTLEPILAGSSCVISCIGPEHNGRLARMAIGLGAHFVDLGSPEGVRAQTETLAEQAERRQRWVVTGCGLSPGLVGVLTMRGVDRLATARTVRIRVGDVPIEPSGPFYHRLAHSAERLLDDYTEPASVLRNGTVETRTPLTGIETVEVEGFGTMEAFFAEHGTRPLVEALAGRVDHLDVKTLRYPGHAERMQFVIDLGLAEKTSLDVRTHLTYRDVLARRLKQRLGGPYQDAVIVRVEIEGRDADGADGTLVYEVVDRLDPEAGLTAMQRCTGYPAAAAAVLLSQHALPGGGVGPADQVMPCEPFVSRLEARGIAVEERWEPAGIPEAA
ncbi:MAG: saccharopine dehydrogenase C-terminal domain-containing protein [Bacteroidota bacterium]